MPDAKSIRKHVLPIVSGLSLGALAAGLVMQHVFGLVPCPLCIFQRIAFFAVFCLALFGSFIRIPHLRLGFSAAGLVAALVGAAIAAHHLTLLFGEAAGSCGADFDYYMENFSPSQWLPMIFRGDGDCMEAAKTPLLGLPLPAWSLLLFFGISALLAWGILGWKNRART